MDVGIEGVLGCMENFSSIRENIRQSRWDLRCSKFLNIFLLRVELLTKIFSYKIIYSRSKRIFLYF